MLSGSFLKLLLYFGNRCGFFPIPNRNADVKTSHYSIESFASNVVDAVGAGDALLSYATLTMLATGSLVIAGILGSMAAACECEYDGNVPISPEYLHRKINEVEEMTGYKTSAK